MTVEQAHSLKYADTLWIHRKGYSNKFVVLQPRIAMGMVYGQLWDYSGNGLYPKVTTLEVPIGILSEQESNMLPGVNMG